MASSGFPTPVSPSRLSFEGHSLLSFLLFALLPHGSLTQSTTENAAPTVMSTPHSSLHDPDDYALVPASGTVKSVALPTGYAGQAFPDDNDPEDDTNHAVLNYYFLLLVIFIAIIVVAYACVLRRRRRKVVRLQGNRQDALTQDLEGWNGGRRWGHGRWRSEPRVEGLNDRGEAPPPYVPERPAATHAEDGGIERERPIPLQDIQKPPDYEESPMSSSEEPGMRPSSRHNRGHGG